MLGVGTATIHEIGAELRVTHPETKQGTSCLASHPALVRGGHRHHSCNSSAEQHPPGAPPVPLPVRYWDAPSVAQHGGVVQRPPPVAVALVDAGSILQQELAGQQGVLKKGGGGWGGHRFRGAPGTQRGGVVPACPPLTAATACSRGVRFSSAAFTQPGSAPWASASAMVGRRRCWAAQYSSAPGCRLGGPSASLGSAEGGGGVSGHAHYAICHAHPPQATPTRRKATPTPADHTRLH